MRVFCIAIYFYSPNRILLKSSLKQKEGNYKEQLSDDGQSLVKYYKLISCDFDFIEDNDLTLAETMDQMATDMKAAYRNLQAIQHSQNYSAGKIFSLIATSRERVLVQVYDYIMNISLSEFQVEEFNDLHEQFQETAQQLQSAQMKSRQIKGLISFCEELSQQMHLLQQKKTPKFSKSQKQKNIHIKMTEMSPLFVIQMMNQQTDQLKLRIRKINHFNQNSQVQLKPMNSQELVQYFIGVEFFENLNIVNMVGGEHHTIALDSAGNVYATGKNDDGQLGLGEELNAELKKEAEMQRQQEEEQQKQNRRNHRLKNKNNNENCLKFKSLTK